MNYSYWRNLYLRLSFQSQKRLYNHKCLFVCQLSKTLNSLKSSSFIIHSSSFIILHSSLIFLHHSTFILRLLSFSACFNELFVSICNLKWYIWEYKSNSFCYLNMFSFRINVVNVYILIVKEWSHQLLSQRNAFRLSAVRPIMTTIKINW